MTQPAWQPKVQTHPHPPGEKGSSYSLEQVAKKAIAGCRDWRIQQWTGECLERSRREGWGFDVGKPHGRAQALLKAVQQKLWIPDPRNTEWIGGAHLMTCVDPSIPCFHGGDCDDLVSLLAACYLNVDLDTMICGHSYNDDQTLQHVLALVRPDKKWLYADPSSKMALGKGLKATRERLLDISTAEKVDLVCDDDVCVTEGLNRKVTPPPPSTGTFVGVDGLPLVLQPRTERPRTERPQLYILSQDSVPAAALEQTCVAPVDLSSSGIEQFAAECGMARAGDWFKSETGKELANYLKGGKPDWTRVASDAGSEVLGGLNVRGLFHDDGSVDWQAAFGEAGRITATALCTASGAGAAAGPVCGAVGEKIGQVVFGWVQGSFFDPSIIFLPPTIAEAKRVTYRYILDHEGPSVQRLLAVRSLAIATLTTAGKLTQIWNAALPKKTTFADTLALMNVQVPSGWTGTLGADLVEHPKSCNWTASPVGMLVDMQLKLPLTVSDDDTWMKAHDVDHGKIDPLPPVNQNAASYRVYTSAQQGDGTIAVIGSDPITPWQLTSKQVDFTCAGNVTTLLLTMPQPLYHWCWEASDDEFNTMTKNWMTRLEEGVARVRYQIGLQRPKNRPTAGGGGGDLLTLGFFAAAGYGAVKVFGPMLAGAGAKRAVRTTSRRPTRRR
jgi:hypothetical protein